MVKAWQGYWHWLSVRLGQAAFRYRSFGPIGFFLPILIFVQPHYPAHSSVWDEVADLLGLVVMMVGEGIRLWGLRAAVQSTRGKVIKARALVTTGAYAVIRNPLYLGNFLIGLGFCVVIGVSWVFLVYGLACGVFYGVIIFAEEAFLARTYPTAYAAYRAQVPRLLPKWPDLARAWKEILIWRGTWKMRKEGYTIAAWLFMALVFEFVEDLKHGELWFR